MSLNTAHLNGGVLIHSGECIILFSDNVVLDWSGQDHPAFKGTKHGRIYLTTHRAVFNSKDGKDQMQSFSFPFVTLSNVELEQPVFGANYIKGKVRAQPNGNWIGEAKFKLVFKSGGAIDFGQAMLRVASMATRSYDMNDAPPPYQPPQNDWYAAPPPAYAPPPQGYYGWTPPTHVFPDQPPANSVFMTSAPPPYPGIIGSTPQGYPEGGGYPQAGYPSPGGTPNPGNYGGGYPMQQPGYGAPPPQGYGAPPSQGYGAPPSQGYGAPPSQGYGAPPQGYGAPPQGYGAPQQNGGYPPQGYPMGGAAGGPGYNSRDAKAAEAAQSAYYDPNRPQMAYVPPPAYYENPPSYDQSQKKDQ